MGAQPADRVFLGKSWLFYAVFFTVELAGAYVAVRMDKEDESLLWWLF